MKKMFSRGTRATGFQQGRMDFGKSTSGIYHPGVSWPMAMRKEMGGKKAKCARNHYKPTTQVPGVTISPRITPGQRTTRGKWELPGLLPERANKQILIIIDN